ncbi:hypothetical protein [Vibrio sp. 10N.239.312.D08]|uniref:hypothetical protein n=1 Tax=Vibrio sp. 10N.239.312.D08 TaxID=3229978 RepID=UPI00354F975C
MKIKKSNLIAGFGIAACAAVVFSVINTSDEAITDPGPVDSVYVKSDSESSTVAAFSNLKHQFVYDKAAFSTFSEFVIYGLSEQDIEVANALYNDYKHLNNLKLATEFKIPSDSIVGSELREEHKSFVSAYNKEYTKAKEVLTVQMADSQKKVDTMQVERGELIENQYEHLNYTGVIKDQIDSRVMDDQATDAEINALRSELASATAKADLEVGDIEEINNKLLFIESELQVMSSDLKNWENDSEGMIDSLAFMNVLEQFKAISSVSFDAFNESFMKLLSNAPRTDLSDDVANVLSPTTSLFFIAYKDKDGAQFYQLVDAKGLNFDESVTVHLDFSQSIKVESSKHMGIRALASL